jgi:type I restriction enzyme, S subunit
LTELGFDPAGVKEASMDEREADDATLAPGEILVARSNTSELVGRVARYVGDPANVVASDLTIRIWPEDGYDGDFLAYQLSFLYLLGFWRERAGGTSSSMKKITRTQLVALDVPKPAIDVQRNLAANLKHGLDRAREIQGEARQVLATLDGLANALLRSAFSGKL